MPKIFLPDTDIFTQEADDEGRIAYVEFHLDEGMPTNTIETRNAFDNANGKALISAYLDLLTHGLFDSPFTDEELGMLFVRADKHDADGNFPYYASDIGFVAVGYDGELKVPSVREAAYPEGWANLHRRNGKFKLSGFSKKSEIPQTRYADWLQAAAQGFNARVRTVPFQPWIEAVIENISIEDPEARLEDRNARYNKTVTFKRVHQKTRAEVSKIKSGKPSSVDVSQPITVRVFGTEEEVNMLDVAPGLVVVHTDRGDTQTMNWDGSLDAKVRFAQISAKNGWTVELSQ